MKKLAFLILAHSDPEHFGKLVSALNDGCDIFVHIDRKSDISAFQSVVSTHDSVQFLSDRSSVAWAGISMIDAQMALIKAALQHKEKYTHVVFLSGADYPIKNMQEIHQRITENPTREFIKFIDMRESSEHYMTHISQFWFKEPLIQTQNKSLKFIDRALRKGLSSLKIKNRWDSKIIPYFGSQWCALTVDCCQYLLDYQAKNPWFREMNKYTFSPDEHYIHTIVGQSPFLASSDGIQPFQGRGTWRLANLHLVDQSLAKWYTVADWETIVSSDRLFVRKVRSKDGKDLVERIKQDLLTE
ncbi:MAG TPA: beta-1,6-N-acetylglucosaminyltransferase [Coleofasciculaceae cyanobacterium]|jgi:hypothetical protein